MIIRCLKSRPQDRPSLSDLLATIKEVSSLEKEKAKSKSTFLAPEKEKLKEKFRKASKENVNPNTNQPTRIQRSTTQVQPKPGKTSELNKK